MRTSSEIIDTIHRSIGDGDKHGLRNTAALLEAMDIFPNVPTVHIAGTNGKGSTCALINRVLTVAGYRTGLYSSPFLQIYNERIRINGTPLSDHLLEKYGNQVLDCTDKLKNQGIHCTPFELGTALALNAFKNEKSEIIILETGMGGRLDPTNAIPTASVCGITAIGMDHMQYLGNTLELIAREKAGIIKENVPVVCQPGEDSIEAVFRNVSEEKKAPLIQLNNHQLEDIYMDQYSCSATFITDSYIFHDLKISLAGEHQLMNALTALNILLLLKEKGLNISENAIRVGFSSTVWPARLEWKDHILMDGAHNAHGIHALQRFSNSVLQNKKKILLTGILSEKVSPEMLTEMKNITHIAVTVTPNSPRAMNAEDYCQLLNKNDFCAVPASTVSDGLQIAQDLAGEDGIIIATGSLYFVGELRTIFGLKP